MTSPRPSSTAECSPQKIDATALREAIDYHLHYSCATSCSAATKNQLARAVLLLMRDLVIYSLWVCELSYSTQGAKRLYYLSMEFHLGRTLGNALTNLGLTETLTEALGERGAELHHILEQESEAALGNGGLARLASCLLDSLATLDLPGCGYGLNYQFGLFRQKFVNGYQVEQPGHWDTEHSPWLIAHPEPHYRVPLYGRVEETRDGNNHYRPVWLDQKYVLGTAHDLPIPGYGGRTVNPLRLFSARADENFDLPILQAGDYLSAIRQQLFLESVSKTLYPADLDLQNLEMQLLQEYFLVSCALQDIIATFLENGGELKDFAKKTAIQLNDTNPALAIAELMRCLVDVHRLDWDSSWQITRETCGYTSHTLLPEAQEKWPILLFEKVLPRHLQLIYEINHRFLQEVVNRFPRDENAPTRMSLIEETGGRQINMSHLAIIGSHSVNGVARLHSQLLRTTVFPDFFEMFPDQFTNVTNGITQRRWLLKANPPLASLITAAIGSDWITRAETLRRLEEFAGDVQFQKKFARTRNDNKQRLADHILGVTQVRVNPQSLFDVQTTRVHEYKRQLLHLMHIIHSYRAMIEDGEAPTVPRTHIFAGKAAPGNPAARLIIKLINNTAEVINRDGRLQDMVKVVMLPDFNVSLAEKIIPAADLSEQVSTAGTEASGTGNMKLAINGALTIGTQNGVNLELVEEIGPENIFIFGLNGAEIEELHTENSYNPWDYYANTPQIRRIVDCLDSTMFCQEEPGLFKELLSSLMSPDDAFCHLADLESYIATQQRVSDLYSRPDSWMQKSILTIARAGSFSSDRTVQHYADRIWNLHPAP